MNVKTLVFDMDGTILNDKKELDRTLINISPQLQAQGKQLIIASGRLTYMIYVYLNELNINESPIVSCNGAEISYRLKKEPLFAATFPMEKMSKLINKARELNLLFHIFTLDGLLGIERKGRLAYYSDANESKATEDQVPILLGEQYLTPQYLERAIKFLVVEPQTDSLAKFRAYAAELDLEVVSSGDNLTDVTLKGITKGNALRILHEKGKLDLSTTMAFGDNDNDISMLKVVKYPIVMGNADEKVKKYAYDVCGENERDGVGTYLQKLFLSEK